MSKGTHTQFDQKGIDEAYELLFCVCDLLEDNKVPYFLEGGTLLGLIRDKELLPWDHDLDISILQVDLQGLLKVLNKLPSKWRISKRYFDNDEDMWKKGELRLIKIKNRHWHFLPGDLCMDIFIKQTYEDSSYWQAGRFIMKADRIHYQNNELVECRGKQLRIPCLVDKYLETKYGDWKTPVKEWDLSKEKSIISTFER